MAATAAIAGIDATLSYSTNGTDFTPLGELRDVNIPKVVVSMADATHYGSDDNTEEMISTGWKKWEPVTFKLNFHKTLTNTLFNTILGATTYHWQVMKNDGSKYVGKGVLSELGGDAIPNKDVIQISGTITPTAKFVFTPAA